MNRALERLLRTRSWGMRRFRCTWQTRCASEEQIAGLPLDAREQAQLAEVASRLQDEPGRHELAIEAMLTRYIPAASARDNLKLFDSRTYWRRHKEMEAQLSDLEVPAGASSSAKPLRPAEIPEGVDRDPRRRGPFRSPEPSRAILSRRSTKPPLMPLTTWRSNIPTGRSSNMAAASTRSGHQ